METHIIYRLVYIVKIIVLSLYNSHMPNSSLRRCYFHASAYCKPGKTQWWQLWRKHTPHWGPWSMINFIIFHNLLFFQWRIHTKLVVSSVNKVNFYKTLSRVKWKMAVSCVDVGSINAFNKNTIEFLCCCLTKLTQIYRWQYFYSEP